ncbi:ribokinase [Ochrobactrum sp. RH2CCR150]|uniref:ribokinase n=1 Tax=Ochrobactrum sp. RH2CCR150 TaxID=2587044 RepID=UPI0015F9EC6D|nr:ribokinase [Ochrobactrum sp. RH2CCR150]
MITVIGSINIDLVAKASRLPQTGETVAGKTFSIDAGGKGANQALAARRAGTDVQFIGAVGQDNFSSSALVLLREENVDLSSVKSVNEPTGTALISVNDEGENAIIVIAGANNTITKEDAATAISAMHQSDVLMLQLEIPANVVEFSLNIARQKGVRSILNIAPFLPDASRLSGLADIIIANETEFQLLAADIALPADNLETALADLHQRSGQSFVVTLGADGVIAVHNGHIYSSNGLTIKPVDTVGAGDTFCGYFAASIAANVPFPEALQRAAIAGSLACTKTGAQEAIPNAKEVETLMIEHLDTLQAQN